MGVYTMGYRIEYGPQERRGEQGKSLSGRSILLTVCVFAVFVLSVRRWWAEGWEVLSMMLLPGDWNEAELAAEAFVQSVRSGSSLSEAVAAFCADIISNG